MNYDYLRGSGDLETIDNILASDLSEGSKLSILAAEYHRLHAKYAELKKDQFQKENGYFIEVPRETIESIAAKTYAQQEKDGNIAEITRWKTDYENLKKSLKAL